MQAKRGIEPFQSLFVRGLVKSAMWGMFNGWLGKSVTRLAGPSWSATR
jgi:hypothetical protein